MKKLQIILIIALNISINLYAFENKLSHPAITRKAISSNYSQVDNYLKKQLGLNDGLSTRLYWDFPTDITDRINKGEADPSNKTRDAIEWFQIGSIIEDEDGRKYPWRPRHHFHDPIRNAGLDNHTDYPNWAAPAWLPWLPLGQSALNWAILGTASQEPLTIYNFSVVFIKDDDKSRKIYNF